MPSLTTVAPKYPRSCNLSIPTDHANTDWRNLQRDVPDSHPFQRVPGEKILGFPGKVITQAYTFREPGIVCQKHVTTID